MAMPAPWPVNGHTVSAAHPQASAAARPQPTTVDLHGMLRYHAAFFTSRTRMPVTILFEEQGGVLQAAEAGHLSAVLDEAFGNIARHAHALQVTLSTRRIRGRLYVRLHDNGLGFEPAKAAKGPGLVRMRAHAIAAGARVWLETEPYGGTTVIFELPASPN